MLKIYIPDSEFWDSNKEEFINIKGQDIQLEHSLVSISKWEQKYHKAFLNTKEKTTEELIDYIQFMTITQNVNPLIFYSLSENIIKQISDYIEDPMTATTFSNVKNQQNGKKDVITSELIYYLMIANGIPFECQKWHINRLLTLIRVCEIKNNPNSKKMSKADIYKNNKALNEMRKAKYNTKG